MADYKHKGSPAYLFGIVLVAVIGGLLFGYDTAVISGAEKGLQAFFKSATDFNYTDGWHGFTTSSALIGCIIGALLSGIMASSLGRKKSLFVAGILFFLSALGSYYPEFLFFEKGVLTEKELCGRRKGYTLMQLLQKGNLLCRPRVIAPLAQTLQKVNRLSQVRETLPSTYDADAVAAWR